MAKKDKKKKGDDAPPPQVTGVDWMNGDTTDGMGEMPGYGLLEEPEEEEEEEKPKKGKGKATDAPTNKKAAKQDKGKGKGKKPQDAPATSGWDEQDTAGGTAPGWDGWGGGGVDAGAWGEALDTQPTASTSQTPFTSLGGMSLPPPTNAHWGSFGHQAPAATPAAPTNPHPAPANPYAAWPAGTPSMHTSMLGLSNHTARAMHTPAAHQMWIPPPQQYTDDDDDDDALAAVNAAAQSGKNKKGKQAKNQDKENQKKGKQQKKQAAQQEAAAQPFWGGGAANDWSEPPPLTPAPSQYDWSGMSQGKKGKQHKAAHQQAAPDGADALFTGGYQAYYTPSQSYTLYAGAHEEPSAFDGSFAVSDTEGYALLDARNALFGRHRPSIQRIHWAFPPHHDDHVRQVMEYIQQPSVKPELTAIALKQYIAHREPGCFFVNATYRLPDRPHTPGFDWLTLSQLAHTYDRIIQQSLLYYQPTEFALVFIFLVSASGNSIACWRRKLPVPYEQQQEYGRAVKQVQREFTNQQHQIFVDSPPLDHFTGFPFSPAVGQQWGSTAGASMYGGASPAPPPEKKVKSGWSWLKR
ncbi:hypothetical protein AURDEDRAFT_180191 [Auricularia subglabra TFB-10046 SS5]|nr:hypothetical protein AURDEDRAFT_180191 [Auricularia subglabra TFB-10046 SS5]